MIRKMESISKQKAVPGEGLKEMPEKVQDLIDLQKSQRVLRSLMNGSNYMKDKLVAWGGYKHTNYTINGEHTEHSQYTEKAGK